MRTLWHDRSNYRKGRLRQASKHKAVHGTTPCYGVDSFGFVADGSVMSFTVAWESLTEHVGSAMGQMINRSMQCL
ncbi:hypothetical protein ASF84_03560 [Pseudomonas sp. Leaf127]|nr:hypothetical protein ASF84_03560 [Pseudomonas sp. Leaf127]